MSMLREAHRRMVTFGSIEKKKIDTVSEANYPINFVESEQIDFSLFEDPWREVYTSLREQRYFPRNMN